MISRCTINTALVSRGMSYDFLSGTFLIESIPLKCLRQALFSRTRDVYYTIYRGTWCSETIYHHNLQVSTKGQPNLQLSEQVDSLFKKTCEELNKKMLQFQGLRIQLHFSIEGIVPQKDKQQNIPVHHVSKSMKFQPKPYAFPTIWPVPCS